MTRKQAETRARKSSAEAFDHSFACKFKDGWRVCNWPAGSVNVHYCQGIKV